MGIVVNISTVADGSMYNRHDYKDPRVIKNRKTYLASQNITTEQTTRLNPNTNMRAGQENEQDWCRYHEVSPNEKGAGMLDGNIVVADALITRDSNHGLFLPVADCVGVALYDPKKHVLMVSHLGRHSLEQQGGTKSIQHLIDHYGCDPNDLLVWTTPAASKQKFPIWALDNQGMKQATFEQLQAAGIKQENITDNPAETDNDINYFSYSEFLKGNRDEDGDHALIAMMSD